MNITTPTGDEMAFVFDSWAESFRKSPWAGVVRNDLYQTTQRATIQGILSRGAVVVVALAPVIAGVHEGRRIMGWACAEPRIEVLHYVYVKQDFRKHGVARALVNHLTSTWFTPRYTHRTPSSLAVLGKRFRWDDVPARVKCESPADRKPASPGPR